MGRDEDKISFVSDRAARLLDISSAPTNGKQIQIATKYWDGSKVNEQIQFNVQFSLSYL